MNTTTSSNVIVVSHPLCEHNLSVIRDKDINSDGFKNSMKRLATILILEATKDLPMKEYKVVESRKGDAEKIMNDMARQGWEVVSVTYWSCWKISLLITFSREF